MPFDIDLAILAKLLNLFLSDAFFRSKMHFFNEVLLSFFFSEKLYNAASAEIIIVLMALL